jgi:hypothetical protein
LCFVRIECSGSYDQCIAINYPGGCTGYYNICNGNTVTVNIAGSQAGINYELFDGVTSLSSPVAGTGGAINIITSALTANTTITVRATNPTTTCTTLLSGTSVVTVTPIPTTPNVTPAGPVVVCEGSAAIVLTSDAGSGNQWYKDGSPDRWSHSYDIKHYYFSREQRKLYRYQYRKRLCFVRIECSSSYDQCVAINYPGSCTGYYNICNGNTVTVNIAGSQAGINYELFDGVTSLSSPVAGTGGAINIITSALTANTTITVRATNPTTTCTTLLSGTSVVTVTPIPTTPNVTPAGPVVVCEGSAAIVLTSDAGSGNQWYKDGCPIGRRDCYDIKHYYCSREQRKLYSYQYRKRLCFFSIECSSSYDQCIAINHPSSCTGYYNDLQWQYSNE